MKHLTIAIPTYNRSEQIKATISLLLPQLTPECFLLIIDNHSDVPVSESLAALLATLPQSQYSIVRNRVNIGGNANIVRCFELCDTP
jgi:abequosyltransferase